MPKYFFTAKSQKGESYSGSREVKDERELARILRQEGYVLISFSPAKEKNYERWPFHIPFLSGVSFKEKMMLARNLQVMIGAGVSLTRALRTFSEQSKNKEFKKTLIAVSEEITKGSNLAVALASYPGIFSALFCNMVKVGEESGTLEKNLGILARQMEREYELKSKVKSALVYPAIIVTAMIGIGTAMLIMVVPKLAQTFEELGVELPLTTRIVIFFGTTLAEKWYLVASLVIVLAFFLRIVLKTKKSQKIIDILGIKTPVVSQLIKKTHATYTIRTLSSLITAGVSLVRSLEIISQTIGNFYFQKALQEAIERVKMGEKLSDALKPYQDLYPLTVVQMIQVGEETGETSKVLEKLSDFFEEEITLATKNLAAVIEPFLMLLVGGVVGFFAISMLQPMYSMLSSIK